MDFKQDIKVVICLWEKIFFSTVSCLEIYIENTFSFGFVKEMVFLLKTILFGYT